MANQDSNTISVINGATNEVVQNVPVGTPVAIAVNPDTNLIYVANWSSDTVSVIDGETNEVLKNITVGTSPYDLEVNPITNTIYVANCGSDTVSIIDGFSNDVFWYIDVGICPKSLAIDLMNGGVYTMDSTDDITIINEETYGTTKLPDLLWGDEGNEITIDSDNNRVYVAELNSNTILAFDAGNVSSILSHEKDRSKDMMRR